MESLLTAVKTTNRGGEFLLTQISSNQNVIFTPKSAENDRPGVLIQEIATHQTRLNGRHDTRGFDLVKPASNFPATTTRRHKKQDSTAFLQKTYLKPTTTIECTKLPDDAREILKNQPDDEDLSAVLQYLQCGIDGLLEFNVRESSAKTAQIINVLVTTTLVDHWQEWNQGKLTKADQRTRNTFISCLTSVGGLGALVASLKQHVSTMDIRGQGVSTNDLISALSEVLNPSQIISTLLDGVLSPAKTSGLQRAASQELCTLIGGSKILGAAASALSKQSHTEADDSTNFWLGDARRYSTWLASRIAAAAARLTVTELEKFTILSQLMQRGLSLGYRDDFVSELYGSLLLGPKAMWTSMHLLLRNLSHNDQTAFLNSMLRDLTRKYLSKKSNVVSMTESEMDKDSVIRGVASIVKELVSQNENLDLHLVDWLTTTTGEYAILGLHTRRAVIATLALHEEKLQRILNKCLENFSDKVSMNHTPILQQEAQAQTILLCVGYLSRINLPALRKVSRSSMFLNTISNRLAASVPRARFLGMLIATAVSRIVDEVGSVMSFEVEEMESQEAQQWLQLTTIMDSIGTLEDLTHASSVQSMIMPLSRPLAAPRKAAQREPGSQVATSKILSIEEVDEDDQIDDLVPYPKPDDDPSDSEEDATLIDRSKPKAPVYIVELIRQLQDTDKPEILHLALKTAPSLIRRKANFGTELSDHIHTVLSSLVNLKDDLNDEDSQTLRLESLVACIQASPQKTGTWMTSIYFEGDFSIAQRASLLSAVGLGNREISGLENTSEVQQLEAFPSQKLPQNLHNIYSPLDSVTKKIEHVSLRPMALEAADKLSGPDVLKVRKFSTRMDVEKKRNVTKKSKERQVRIQKELHHILAEIYYLPLCCKLSLLVSSNSMGYTNIFEPHLLKMFLQTLIVLLDCLGPHAIQLSAVTRETLNLLVALHNQAKLALDAVVLPQLLQALLTLLDLNVESGLVGEERLVTDFGSLIHELVTWSSSLADNFNITTGAVTDGMPWSVIAAGCQVKWHEIGRKFQGQMLGLTSTELDDL